MKRITMTIAILLVALNAMAGNPAKYLEDQKVEMAAEIAKADNTLAKAQEARDNQVKRSVKKYIAALNKVMTHYTKKGNLDKAIEIRSEIAAMEKFLGKKTPKKVVVTVVDKPAKKLPPKEAVKYGNSHYLVVKKATTWKEAQAECEAMGGYLATITTKGENDFIKDLSRKAGGGLWVGASKKGKTWKWTTGASLSYKNWNKKTNKKGDAEDSIVVAPDGWWANDAKLSRMFICEWK